MVRTKKVEEKKLKKKEMRVEIDGESGFCFGVVKAISTAEESLAEGRKVYSLGDIVHNRVEVQRLENKGLKPLKHQDLDELKSATVLIRAHGEPPKTYKKAKANKIEIIDATCPVVARLQRIVKEAHKKMKKVDGQLVILGKKGHSEVIGLTGQVDEDVVIVEKLEDIEVLDFSKPIYLLSQTTQSLSLFGEIANEIKQRASNPENVTLHDTICRQVANREPHLKDFAKDYDLILFVCGQKSSNGAVLYEVCKRENPRSYKIEDENELKPEWFENVESVGICGATSTPKWLMNQVAEACKQIKK